MILELQAVSKSFLSNKEKLKVLSEISFSMEEKDILSIVGPSGSGKTTLLGLCAGLDQTSEGKVILDQTDLSQLNQDELAEFRNQTLGFVFQNFQLIPTLSALENVMLPAELIGAKSIKDRALKCLNDVGLSDRVNHYPIQMSGGEQQRVAIARAFINSPKVLFADEPTGNLDEETSQHVINLLFDLNKENDTSLVIVTHDLELASKGKRIIRLKGGRISSDELL